MIELKIFSFFIFLVEFLKKLGILESERGVPHAYGVHIQKLSFFP